MLRVSRAAMLLCCMSFAAQPVVAQFDATIEHSLFDSANTERAQAGLPLLTWNDKLMQAARLHAEMMAAENKMSHRAEGEPELFYRLGATHLPFIAASENVAFATYAEDIHPGWMRSPGHRANILRADSNALGVAVLKVAKGYYAVQDFAHTTSSDDAPIAELRFAAAFQAARKQNHKLRVKITQPTSLRAAACEMALNDKVAAKSVPIDRGFHVTLAYTAAEPDEFPNQVRALAADSALQEMQVGSCYKATPHFPGGIYWFVIVY